MAMELYLWHDCAGWNGGVLRLVPDHHSAVGTHSCDYIGVLRLIAGLVHFARMAYLLNDIELDLNGLTPRWPTAVAPNFFRLLVIILDVWLDPIRELDVCNLEEIWSAI